MGTASSRPHHPTMADDWLIREYKRPDPLPQGGINSILQSVPKCSSQDQDEAVFSQEYTLQYTYD